MRRVLVPLIRTSCCLQLRLRNTFDDMDTTRDGRLEWEKVQNGLRKYGVELTSEEGKRVRERVEVDSRQVQ